MRHYSHIGRRRKAWLVNRTGVLVQRGKRLPGYYARFYEYRLGGSRKNRSKHSLTQANARRWVRECNARIDLGHHGEIVPISLREAVDDFAPGLAPLSPDTRTHYMKGLGLFQAVAGDRPVSEIGGGHVDRFVAAHLAVSAEATVAKRVRALKWFFNWAVKRGYHDINLVSQATSPPSETRARERPSVSEQDLVELVEAADTEDRKLAVWVAVTTGLDRGVIERPCGPKRASRRGRR